MEIDNQRNRQGQVTLLSEIRTRKGELASSVQDRRKDRRAAGLTELRQLNRGEGRMSFPQRFPITCSKCQRQDTVPFEPDGKRPVYCRECHRKMKLAWEERHRRLAETRKKLEADDQTRIVNLTDGKNHSSTIGP